MQRKLGINHYFDLLCCKYKTYTADRPQSKIHRKSCVKNQIEWRAHQHRVVNLLLHDTVASRWHWWMPHEKAGRAKETVNAICVAPSASLLLVDELMAAMFSHKVVSHFRSNFTEITIAELSVKYYRTNRKNPGKNNTKTNSTGSDLELSSRPSTVTIGLSTLRWE